MKDNEDKKEQKKTQFGIGLDNSLPPRMRKKETLQNEDSPQKTTLVSQMMDFRKKIENKEQATNQILRITESKIKTNENPEGLPVNPFMARL